MHKWLPNLLAKFWLANLVLYQTDDISRIYMDQWEGWGQICICICPPVQPLLPLYSPPYLMDSVHIWDNHWPWQQHEPYWLLVNDYGISIFVFEDSAALWNFMYIHTLTDLLLGLGRPRVPAIFTRGHRGWGVHAPMHLLFSAVYRSQGRQGYLDVSNVALVFIDVACCHAECLLTHWGRVTHICVGKLTNIGSDNGLSPGRRQAIIWTNAGISLIGPFRTNLSEILFGIQTFSFKNMHLKMSSAEWRPFCLGLNVLNCSKW